MKLFRFSQLNRFRTDRKFLFGNYSTEFKLLSNGKLVCGNNFFESAKRFELSSKLVKTSFRKEHMNFKQSVCYLFVSSIYPPDSWDNVKHRAIVTQTHFRDTGSTMSACFLCLLLYTCRCETDTYAVFPHHTKSLL